MTPDEFATAAVAILGTAIGWQSAIARRLGVGSRTVRRWLDETLPIPEGIAAQMAEMMDLTDIRPWPRDEWVVGDGVTADGRPREYIVHLMPPRFVARIVACDVDGLPMPEEKPADVLSGAVYSSDETLLCEIEWWDEPPPGQVTQLLEAACDALDDINERA